MKRPVDNLAEARLGILNQESILRAPNRWRRHRKLARGSRGRRTALDLLGQIPQAHA
jgi:hypothetical protein